jgi:hypothetical protein
MGCTSPLLGHWPSFGALALFSGTNPLCPSLIDFVCNLASWIEFDLHISKMGQGFKSAAANIIKVASLSTF